MLRGGAKFVKYSTEGKAQDRWVWMSQDLSKLCWARFKNSLVNTQPSWVAIEEITRVTLGRSTPVTRLAKADESSLLSIHTESRIIDLGVPVTTSDSPTRDQWASLFVWMLENKQRPGAGVLLQQVRAALPLRRPPFATPRTVGACTLHNNSIQGPIEC